MPFTRQALCRSHVILVGAAALGFALWLLVYRSLAPLADALVDGLGLPPGERLTEAVRFFAYDTPKIFWLVALIMFTMGVVRTFFAPERTRTLLAGRREGVGNVMAALVGVVTPFCSCSAVPLFVGLISAGVPLGVAFSFLIAAPMVNEVALGLLVGLVGWKIALVYAAFGLGVAIVGGIVIGRLRLETWLQRWVLDLRVQAATTSCSSTSWTVRQRLQTGLQAMREGLARLAPWVLIGVGLGAFLHGYVPATLLATLMGGGAWWSVPAATLIGVPLYANAASIMPLVETLLDKGLPLGTVLAFMMSVTALSLPEALILRNILTLRLLALFFGSVALGIMGVGFVFNALIG